MSYRYNIIQTNHSKVKTPPRYILLLTVLFSAYFLFNLIRMCLTMIKASSAFQKDEEIDGYCIENAAQ